jgi:plasmid stabilization system protein ParE
MKILFTKRAKKNYHSIKNLLYRKWDEKVALAFEEKTIQFLDLLEQFPEIGSIELKEKQIRGFPLTKHTRLFYRLSLERIIILNFFDVRQNPKKKLK